MYIESILCSLTRIFAGDHVPVIGPDTVDRAAVGVDPQVVAVEGDVPVPEHLVLRLVTELAGGAARRRSGAVLRYF